MTTLTAGEYQIRNGRWPVARSLAEDKSRGPKAVFTLWQDSQVRGPWSFEPVTDIHHGFIFSNAGAPTGVLPSQGDDQKLFGFLSGEAPTVWKVTHVPSAGKNSFVISSAAEGKFWYSIPPRPGADSTIPGAPNQVEIRRLLFNPVEPITYPPEVIFEVHRVE
ncbi:hypothetical protein D9757_006007 [Collybiopsis confluens]|uniref:Uncharacterized protein n=1 Tax=Collybiopsis confluens TaxID=2823264 RepID=A0A8H5MD90_9AGAR|nr:hypothetical protein D9757_013491 [Collybiopsis confluens]KAF5389722.1 hypothetical protein D9757_006007 [Collybiopsis confluens]